MDLAGHGKRRDRRCAAMPIEIHGLDAISARDFHPHRAARLAMSGLE